MVGVVVVVVDVVPVLLNVFVDKAGFCNVVAVFNIVEVEVEAVVVVVVVVVIVVVVVVEVVVVGTGNFILDEVKSRAV